MLNLQYQFYHLAENYRKGNKLSYREKTVVDSAANVFASNFWSAYCQCSRLERDKRLIYTTYQAKGQHVAYLQ